MQVSRGGLITARVSLTLVPAPSVLLSLSAGRHDVRSCPLLCRALSDSFAQPTIQVQGAAMANTRDCNGDQTGWTNQRHRKEASSLWTRIGCSKEDVEADGVASCFENFRRAEEEIKRKIKIRH